MRVLHLIDSGGVYGAEIMLLGLVAAQLAAGIDAEIGSIGLAGEPERALERECRQRGIPCRSIRFSPSVNVFAAARLLRAVRREGIDLLHTHGYKPDILFGLLRCLSGRIPTVATVHGWTETRRFSKMGLYQALDRLSWFCMDRVVAVAQASPVHRTPCLQSRAVTIENGIASHEPDPAQPEPAVAGRIASHCRGRPCIAMVSRLSPEKGLDTMLAALAQLREAGADYALVIVGEGPERERIERQIAEQGLEGQVLLTGYVEEAFRLMPRFDVLAIPSRTEGLPITLLEAMAGHVAVIATRVGQIPAVLDQGNCGHLLEPGDAGGLADGIRRLVEDRSYRETRVSNAARRVREYYSIVTTADRYAALYAGILAGTRDRGVRQ